MKNYVKDYPRPQQIRDNWINLNGQWDFAYDDANIGETSGDYTHGLPSGLTINVPFTYETKLSGIADPTPHGIVWYQKKIELTKKGKHRILLHFEGSDYTTKVFVNGAFIGQHKGGYERFSFDITDASVTGTNTIIVRVEDSFSLAQPRGKQRWEKENFACWYVQTTGIWKTVWIEEVPNVYINNIRITPDLVAAEAITQVNLTGVGSGEKGKYTIKASVSFEGTPISQMIADVKYGTSTLNVNVNDLEEHPWGFHHWSPANPALYDLTLELLEDGRAIDTVKSYFGMREIRIDGANILLNDNPLYEKLILDQGYWPESGITPPSEEALIEDIDKIQAMGFNGLRKHMKIEDERFLYWCDVKGMLVWSEMPATYVFNEDAVQNFTDEWVQIVRQNYNHPSIITWTPFNESWGVPRIKTQKQQQDFTKGIYYLTKSLDPMRPVITNDGWEHTCSDIITLHDYEELGEVFSRRYEDKDKITGNEIYHNKSRCAMADGCEYNGQPIIISEYGGIAFTSKHGEQWGYGNAVPDEAAFLERYRKITDAIFAVPYICGFCYTQVSDVEQEVNGLMTAEREFKVNPEELKKINNSKDDFFMECI